jgi:hypothetical protein
MALDEQNQAAGQDDVTRSRSELVATLPTLRRLVTQLQETVKPARVAFGVAPEACAIDQAVAAIAWMVDAVDAPAGGERIMRLTEVANRADYVTRAAHERLAEVQSMAELAAGELDRRVDDAEDTAIVDRAQLDISLPNGTRTTVVLTVDGDGHVTWEAAGLDLAPIDGLEHLAIAHALARLGEMLTAALPDAVVTE